MRKPKTMKSLLNLPLIFYILKKNLYKHERKPDTERKLHKKGQENLATIRKVGSNNFKIQQKDKQNIRRKKRKIANTLKSTKTQTFKNTYGKSK